MMICILVAIKKHFVQLCKSHSSQQYLFVIWTVYLGSRAAVVLNRNTWRRERLIMEKKKLCAPVVASLFVFLIRCDVLTLFG